MLYIYTGKQNVLIIEDEPTQRHLLRDYLEKLNFTVFDAENGESGLAAWEDNLDVRIVITDLEMPSANGYDVIRKIRKNSSRDTYVIVLTAHDDKKVLVKALSLGADDFISKPIDRNELALRMESAKRQLRLKDQNKLVSRMAELAAVRSGEIDRHLKRTREYCRLLADDLRRNNPELGLTKETVDDLAHISVLHDIGKINIPDGLLNKRGRLTNKEYEIIKEHTVTGASFLKKLHEETGSMFLLLGYEMAIGHHERWDGKGYPQGVKGDKIPLSARIMAFADAYDAILSRRPYKDPLPAPHAETALIAEKGKQFDPLVVEAFERNTEAFLEIHNLYPDTDYF